MEEKLRLEREEAEKLRLENEEKLREEEEKNKAQIPDMNDLGNISGIDGGMDAGDNMDGGDFGDENMGD